MNRMDRSFTPGVEAQLEYLDGEFRILRQGSFVICAVTGVAIPLEDLRYWSVARQEAYAGPDVVLRRVGELGQR